MESILINLGESINILPYYGIISDWEWLYKQLNKTTFWHWMHNVKKYDEIFKQNKKAVFKEVLRIYEDEQFPFYTKPYMIKGNIWTKIELTIDQPREGHWGRTQLKYIDAIHFDLKLYCGEGYMEYDWDQQGSDY